MPDLPMYPGRVLMCLGEENYRICAPRAELEARLGQEDGGMVELVGCRMQRVVIRWRSYT